MRNDITNEIEYNVSLIQKQCTSGQSVLTAENIYDVIYYFTDKKEVFKELFNSYVSICYILL